ncbi:MPN domain-containing protein [Thelohanellus kitauei]|uniref:MPN domain-containing protein n=1 Tax=Thelohanellus kitauei TaxID=669202 RepID=A0A0C2MYN9_THEKT|nr:MPN domain-containing protein [Thelohanellus kitauei]
MENRTLDHFFIKQHVGTHKTEEQNTDQTLDQKASSLEEKELNLLEEAIPPNAGCTGVIRVTEDLTKRTENGETNISLKCDSKVEGTSEQLESTCPELSMRESLTFTVNQGSTSINTNISEFNNSASISANQKALSTSKSGSSSSQKKSEKKKYQPKSEITVKKLPIRSWTPSVSSIEYMDVAQDTPKTTLIKLKQNQKLNSSQPNILIDSDPFLIMDFHAHICLKDVNGFLFGICNSLINSVRIVEALPIVETWSIDPPFIDEIINKVANLITERRKYEPSYFLVGRYTSNLDIQPEPSITDIKIHEDCLNRFKDVINDNTFFTMIVSPYYDPKKVANIESHFNLYSTSSVQRPSGFDIALPMKCDYKKAETDVTEKVLKRLELLSAMLKKTGSMLNMTVSYWHEIDLRDKMIGSCMQHIDKEGDHQPIINLLFALASF